MATGGSLNNDIDDVLCSVAEKLWEDAQVERLGKKLGIDIATVKRHNKGNYAQGLVSHEGTKSMLREWANGFKSDTFWLRLKEALEGAKLHRVAEDVENKHSSLVCSGTRVKGTDQSDTGRPRLNMASNENSVILTSDWEIYALSELFHAVDVYFKLGRVLLGSEADVANIIGRTNTDNEEVVFKCLYTWRNANGSRASDALLSIFSDLQLSRAKSFLKNELQTNQRCLEQDKFLQDLTHHINCPREYRRLGLKLVKNAAALENIIGHLNPQYQEAFHKVLIKWRDREGASLVALEKLKNILEENGQMEAVDWIDEKEYGRTRNPVRLSESEAKPSTDEASASTGDAFPTLLDTTSPRSSGAISRPKPLRTSNQQSATAPMRTKEDASNSRAACDLEVQNPLQSGSQQQGAMNPGRSGDFSGPMEHRSVQEKEQFYDIYLVYSAETEDVRKVKKIIQRKKLTMTTPFDSRLGVPETESIEHALETSSHVVLVITEEDCRVKDNNRTLTIEMAFQSASEGSLWGRVIPILCCNKSCLPLKLRTLTSANINDPKLETRLVDSIDTSIRLERFQSLSIQDSPTSS